MKAFDSAIVLTILLKCCAPNLNQSLIFLAGGEGLLAKKTLALNKLGTKRQCLACGAKYYDLGRKPPVCSRCGASAEPKRAGEPVEEATVGAQASRAAETPPSRPIGRTTRRLPPGPDCRAHSR